MRLRLAAVMAAAAVAAVCLLACSAVGIESGEPELGAANPGQLRDNTPVVLATEQPGILVAQDAAGIIDYSHTDLGYICAQTYSDERFKVLVWEPDGSRYQYTIETAGTYINIPLSCGDGLYTAGLYKWIEGDNYATQFKFEFEVTLSDQRLPFLYPNRYVDFAPDDEAVRLSVQVTEGATSEIEALDAIYLWCVMNLTYDYDKAETVQPGYLPVNRNTLDSRTGICFDYAVLCASMMRAQGLPTKLEIGYYGEQYHAWISVYTTENGVIRREVTFSPDTWTMLDPTVDSANAGPLGLGPYTINVRNYNPMFFY